MVTSPNSRAKLLIVDDDLTLSAFCRRFLSRAGYLVRTAASAEEGLAVLADAAPDLILLDLRLPGMDGLEFLRALLKHDPAPPVLMMSGYATLEDAMEATRLGVADIISKPFSPAELLTRIRRLLATGPCSVEAWIGSNFTTIRSRKDVAQRFGTSLGTVTNWVRRHTRQSFLVFLQSCRVREAQRLLSTSELEIKEIATQVGFGSRRSMDRVVRAHTGRSPSQYRTEARASSGS